MTDRELLQQALDALDLAQSLCEKSKHHAYLLKAYEALRARLAQPEPEPVAYDLNGATVYIKPPLYTAPQKKEWVGLTDEEIKNSMQGHNTQVDFARAIEAKLKEKNS